MSRGCTRPAHRRGRDQKFVDPGDTSWVSWQLAVLLHDVPDPRIDEALLGKLSYARAIYKSAREERVHPDPVFALEEYPWYALWGSGAALWVLAHRSGSAKTLELLREFEAETPKSWSWGDDSIRAFDALLRELEAGG